MITNACASGKSSVIVRWIDGPVFGRQQLRQPRGRAAGQRHGRLAAGQVDHAHVAPEHAVRHAGAQRLGAGLLGGEALGVGGRAPCPALGPGLLDLGEDALDEALAIALQRLLDAADVDQVAPMPMIIASNVPAAGLHRRDRSEFGGSPSAG